MSKLSLTFTDLNDDEYDYLVNAWRTIRSVGLKAEPKHHRSLDEYDAARQHVEQPRPQVAPAVPQPALNAAIEIDATGVPWNEQYHSSGRTKTKKGEWMLRKGVDKDAAEKWRAQHARGNVAAPQVAAGAAPVAPSTPGPISVPGGVVMPSPVHPHVVAPDYGTWVTKFMAAYNSGRIPEHVLNHLNSVAGVPDASHYATNDNARAITMPMIEELLAVA